MMGCCFKCGNTCTFVDGYIKRVGCTRYQSVFDFFLKQIPINYLPEMIAFTCKRCNSTVCGACIEDNVSGEFICRPCEIECAKQMILRFWNVDVVLCFKTLLLIRNQWRRDNCQFGMIPREILRKICLYNLH